MCPITAGGAGPALDSSLRPGPLAHPRASWRGPAARVRVSQSNLVSHKESRFLMTAGSDSVALTCSRPLSSSQSLTAKGGGSAAALARRRSESRARSSDCRLQSSKNTSPVLVPTLRQFWQRLVPNPGRYNLLFALFAQPGFCQVATPGPVYWNVDHDS